MIHVRSAAWLAILSGLCWILLLVPIPSPWAEGRAWALPLAGAFFQFLVVAALVQHASERPAPTEPLDVPVAILIAGAALIAGIASQKVDVVKAVLLFLCGSAALILVSATIRHLNAGRTIEVTSHSGGLGGSLGGWRISGVAVMALLILFLVGAIVALAPGVSIDGDIASSNRQDAAEGAETPGDSPPAASPSPPSTPAGDAEEPAALAPPPLTGAAPEAPAGNTTGG